MTRRPNLELLSMEDALAAAARILADPHRNCVRISSREVVSLVVLARQLVEIAEAATRLLTAEAGGEERAERAGLARQLVAAGFLPSSHVIIGEPAHG